jgi:hypothetical protein
MQCFCIVVNGCCHFVGGGNRCCKVGLCVDHSTHVSICLSLILVILDTL